MFNRILVLCVGNICRSPMAEALLRERLRELGRTAEVRSAGIGALAGRPADQNVLVLMSERGLDLSQHRAVQVSREMLHWADLVLVMEEPQRAMLRMTEPTAAGKVFRLGHWIGSEIPDPYLADLSVFEETLSLIELAVSTWTDRL